MLEYFTYKKFKKHQEKKVSESATASPAASPATSPFVSSAVAPAAVPILNQDDENFLARIVSGGDDTPPPLPARPASTTPTPDDGDESLEKTHKTDKGKAPAKEDKKWSRLSFMTYLPKKTEKKNDGLEPEDNVPADEAAKEEAELAAVLDQLNLAAKDNHAFSLSRESQELVKQFTQVLKDLVNGAPTAYDDLTHLLDGSSEQLSKTYEKLPSGLQKLIAALPSKMTSSLAPELLAVAAEAQALSPNDVAAANGSLSAAAKRFLHPANLKDLVTQRGAIAGLLKAIMNALKTRFPAFLGTNVLWSLALFVLLFVFWYCHKRGREVRLEQEQLLRGESTLVDSEAGSSEKLPEIENDGEIPDVTVTEPTAGTEGVPTPLSGK